jgi:hypothetical protein
MIFHKIPAVVIRTSDFRFLAAVGTKFAKFPSSMTMVDITILYFAIGLPFGVHFFLKNRFADLLWLKAFAATLLWIPYSVLLLHQRVTKMLINSDFDKKFLSVSKYQKNIEIMLVKNKKDSSLFDFREVAERYIALTLNLSEQNQVIGENKKELFRIANTKNIDLSAICLNRINVTKLRNHQSNSRKDFFNFLKSISGNQSDRREIWTNADLIAESLGDGELASLLAESMPHPNIEKSDLISASNVVSRKAA